MRTAVIPAAGKGERMTSLPLTRVLPKVLLPVPHHPVIEYALRTAKQLGNTTVYIVVNRENKELLEAYFAEDETSLEIRYLIQKDPNGIGGAILKAVDVVSDPFDVILGDDLTFASNWSGITTMFKQYAPVGIQASVADGDTAAIRRSCCLTLGKAGRITEIKEKPTKPFSNVRGIGVYRFDRRIFDFIRRTRISPLRKEREITDTMHLLAEKGLAYSYLIKGRNFNINGIEDLVRATRFILSRSRN
jgi:dTDP-glucose pyrophosphorylase